MSSRLAVSLARGIRAERARHGWSQADLAGRLGWARQTVAKIEAGDRSVRAEELPELCAALEVPLGRLLQDADPDELARLGLT